MKTIRLVFAVCVLTAVTCGCAAPGEAPQVEKHRVDLYDAWHALPAPPITPYSGPFGDDARAFMGKVQGDDAVKAFFDWKRQGLYDPEKDTRKINLEFEKATLDDWRRMGYNCSYKGGAFTYRVGRFLKKNGMLGAIDQTLWGNGGPGPLSYDGKEGPRQREACSSIFARENFDSGVETLVRFVTNFGDPDMLKVGGTYVTCSWDEVGMRERAMIDYRAEAVVEYRRYLKEVWFRDESPDKDTSGDGCTYDAFTGENLKAWDEVKPPTLTPRFYSDPKPVDEKWTRPGAYKLWMDFHRYYTFEFFRRTNEEASKRLGGGRRVECYPFPQAFIMWPAMDCFWGMSQYWNCRINPIVNIEQCWPESPAMTVNYAMTDHMARKYRNIVMGWSWFYFGQEGVGLYEGPYDNGRALARMMGHRVDGIHHWLYSPIYRGRDQRQRLQIAYWHNFLAHHYQGFLSKSEPVPAQVALLMPDWTGYFYRVFNYPKMDWAYTAEGLQEAQIPYEVVFEEELEQEPGALGQYKVLYVVGSEWTTPTVRKRVEDFIKGGGVVFANLDSLSLDISTGKRTDVLEKAFGVKIERKHKNSFLPSAQTAEEEEWSAQLNGWGKATWLQGHDVHKPGVYAKIWKAEGGKVVRNEEEWAKLDTAMAKMPKEVRGIAQSPLDMREPPKVRYAEGVGPTEPTVTWSEVDTAKALAGKPIAWYGDAVCGVETERTVWLGTRPGMDLHAISPRMSMNRTTEPCNPYVTEVSDSYAPHKPYVDVIAYAAKKAGVKPLVTVTLGGRVPCNLEVLPRADADGTLMVFVINHDATDATYQVAVAPEHLTRPALKGAQAWDLLGARLIEDKTDGAFELKVEPWKVAVFMVGTEQALAPVKAAQARLNAMDLSVPEYFVKRPPLNEYEWNTPVPAE